MDAIERRKRASAEAAEWWVRLEAQDMSRTEREEYVDWLRESALHVAEMLRVAQVHGALDKFERWGALSTEGAGSCDTVVVAPEAFRSAEPDRGTGPAAPETRGAPGEADRRVRSHRVRFAVAASVAVVASLGAWLFMSLRVQTIETDRGERREVALADGSVLEVDPQTRLRVNFDEHMRRVALERGRALFRVAKNPDRPFLVQADGTTVRAVGTAFGVDRQREGVVVTVAEGKVAVFATDSASLQESRSATNGGESTDTAEEEVTAPGRSTSTPQPRARTHAKLYLTAGQQVTMASSGSAEPVRIVDSNRELAWAKGRLVFDNVTLAAAIEEFNRYNRVQLHVVDVALGKRLVSAVFDASDPESFIAFVQTVAPVRVTRSDPMNITIAMEVK